MTSLLAETRDSLQELTTNLETEAKKVGLRIELRNGNCIEAQKTKTMQIGGEQAMTPLSVSQQTIQNVDRFTCTSVITLSAWIIIICQFTKLSQQ